MRKKVRKIERIIKNVFGKDISLKKDIFSTDSLVSITFFVIPNKYDYQGGFIISISPENDFDILYICLDEKDFDDTDEKMNLFKINMKRSNFRTNSYFKELVRRELVDSANELILNP